MRRIKVFLFNGIFLCIISLILRVVAFTFNIYVINKIGAEALGAFGLIMSVYMLSITVATSGVNLATVRLVVEENTKNSEYGNKYLIRKCLNYGLTLGTISCIILIIFSPYISQIALHDKVPSYLFYIIAISLPAISCSSAINGYFSGLRKEAKNGIIKIFEEFVKIISTIYFFNFFKNLNLEKACLSLVLGETISEIASFLLSFFLYTMEKRKYIKHYNGEKYKQKILKIALPVAVTSYVRSGLSSLKHILIPLRLEKSGMNYENAISEYGKINGMAFPVLMFPEVIINSFSVLLIPEFSYYYEKKWTERISITISRIIKISAIFSIGVIGVFLCMAKEISFVIYNNLEIATYIKILCPLILFMYIDGIVDSILKGLDKQVAVMKCNVLDLFVSILCIYFLLPIYGSKGYLIVIFVSELLNSGMSLMQLKSETKFKIDVLEWVLKPIVGILIANILFKIIFNRHMSGVIELILKIIVFLLIYFFIVCVIENKNKRII